jgi:ribosomal protein S12 methylthiotransferase
MKLQNKISTELQKEMIGKELEVLVETKTFDNRYYVGRSYREVPEIDGIIYIEMIDKELEGKFIKVKITDATEYDLIGKII